MNTGARYAIYWAPERDDALWVAGCEWLGRDPECPGAVANARPETGEPGRYGIHATLKAPMRLVDGVDEHALFDMLERLTARTSAFAMPMMEVSTLRDFVAVLPTRPIAADHPLRRLADACVTQTDGLRLAGSEAELRRRTRSQALDAQEISLLQRWGYPYVFDCWKFHMTLSDSMHDQTVLERLLAEARRHFAAALADQLMCTSVSVFTESVAGAPFMLTRRFAFRR